MPDDTLNSAPATDWRTPTALRIGDYRVLPASNELVGPTGVRRLRPRLMHVLLRLAASPGEVVPRQTLLDDVWPRRAVADEVLSRTIAELRTALADDARGARYVETIPKVGYRLVAPVARDVADRRPAPPAVADEPTGQETIAEGTAAGATSAAGATASPSPPARVARPAVATAVLAVAAIAAIAAVVVTRPVATEAQRLERQLAVAVPFSSDPALELAPRFSPDGADVVFAAGSTERSQLVVQNVATGARRTLGDADAFRTSPVYFPDGARLAYFRRSGDDCAIVEHTLAGARERVLVDCQFRPFTRFDVAPDGRQIAYATRDGLRLHDVEAGSSTPLTQPGAGDVQDIQPRFSPDGRDVAFFRSQPAGRELWLVPVADPTAARAAGSPPGNAYGLAWLGPRGPVVAAVDWSGFRALHLFDLDTRQATLVGARGAQFPDVDRNGDIVYENAAYQANLHLLDSTAPGDARVLWPSTRYSSTPAFAPDGRRVAFISNRDGVASLFVGTLDGDARRIPVQAEGVYTRPVWSPDGTALYAVRDPTGGKDPGYAVRIDPATGAVVPLPALGDGVAMIFIGPDGDTLYAGVREGDAVRVVRASRADPAQQTRLPLPPVASFRVRGQRLVYTTRSDAGLVGCSLPELACARIDGVGGLSGTEDWALADDAIWFGNARGPFVLRRYDFDAGRVTAEFPLAPTALGPAIAVSGDGRHVIVARQDPPAIDLMLARRAALR